ncbi:MAG: hypothetical protein WBZ33_03205 [Thermoactinomyces sp.]
MRKRLQYPEGYNTVFAAFGDATDADYGRRYFQLIENSFRQPVQASMSSSEV